MNDLDPAVAARLKASWAELGDRQVRPIDGATCRIEKARARWLIEVMGLVMALGAVQAVWGLARIWMNGPASDIGHVISGVVSIALMGVGAHGHWTGRRHAARLAWIQATSEETARWHAHPRSQQHWLDCMASPMELMAGDREVLNRWSTDSVPEGAGSSIARTPVSSSLPEVP